MKIGIFHTAFLGDLVLASLLIEGLFIEGHEIYLVTKNLAANFYKDDKRIKKIITINKGKGIKKLHAIFDIANVISNLDLDVLLVPHKSMTTSLIVFLTKAKNKIGFSDTSLPYVFTHLQKFYQDKHESLRCLGIAPEWLISAKVHEKLTKLARPILYASHNFDVFLRNNPQFFSDKKPFFIVSPGSVWATKKYPAKHFAKVIESVLLLNSDLRCVLSGGAQDKIDIQAVLVNIKNKLIIDRVFDTSNYLPLNEFTNLVALSSFIVANDSSPVHIASGLNIPVIAIYGPTTWKFGFYPTSEKSIFVNYKDAQGHLLSCHPCSPHGTKQCPKKHFKCMEDLSSDIILQSIKTLVPQLF